MKKIILVIALVLLFYPLQQNIVKAETSTDLYDFREFDSFMKRYHEHTTELVYYTSTAYKSNEHYFGENIDLLKQGIDATFDEGLLNSYLNASADRIEGLLNKPVALLATANDLRSMLFGKLLDFFKQDDYSHISTANDIFYPPEGYYFKIQGDSIDYSYQRISASVVESGKNYKMSVWFTTTSGGNISQATGLIDSTGKSDEMIKILYDYFRLSLPSTPGEVSFADFINVWNAYSQPNIYLVNADTNESKPLANRVAPPALERTINNIVNNYNGDGLPSDYSPEVEPQLVCPNEVIPLEYELGTFKTSDGQIVTISEDETVNYLETICNLDFAFPEIYYHDDTGSLIVDGEDLFPTGNAQPFDMGIVDYIRNSYNYATSVISMGVNGLKSIVAGTTGLITFTGSIFAFLPPEILTLFIGGFSIALGLWVFKK